MNIDKDVDFIEVYSGLLDNEWCTDVIKYFDHVEKNSITVSRDLEWVKDEQYFIGDMYNNDNEVTAMHADLAPKYTAAMKLATRKYFRKYPHILNSQGNNTIVDYKIQKTRPGEGFTGWHYENGDMHNHRRFLTFMIYLNDITDGGETEFLYQQRKIKPKAGDILIWPAGLTHVHRGNKPTKETKYAITTWMEFTT